MGDGIGGLMNGRTEAILDTGADSMMLLDMSGSISYFSAAAKELFGYSHSECNGKHFTALLADSDREKFKFFIENFISRGEGSLRGRGHEVKGRRKNGDIFDMRMSIGFSDYQEDGEAFFLLMCFDLSAYREALSRLNEAEKHYSKIVKQHKDLVCTIDHDFNVYYYNTAIKDTFEYEGNDNLKGSFLRLFDEHSRFRLRQMLTELFKREVDNHTVKTLSYINGRSVKIEWRFSLVSNIDPTDASMEYVTANGVDISETHNAIIEADYIKTHDSVTGLYNKEGFLSAIKDAMVNKKRYCVLFMNIPSIEAIGRQYGTEVKDKVIHTISDRIRDLAGSSAIIGRGPQTRFFVGLTVVDFSKNTTAVNTIINGLLGLQFEFDPLLHLSIHCGTTIYPDNGEYAEGLLKLAEAISSESRAQRSFAYIEKHNQDRVREKFELERGVVGAMEFDKFDIHLQEKFSLNSRRIVGFEALARLQQSPDSTVPPTIFVAALERMGKGLNFDRYIFDKVCKMVVHYQEDFDYIPPICVNLTGNHVFDERFYEFVMVSLNYYGISGSQFIFEIRESMLIKQIVEVDEYASIQNLKGLGVQFSLDDFGTGHSSLSYLKNLPIDFIKIEESFIHTLNTDKDIKLAKAIVSMAQTFEVKTVAKGIETNEQLQLLKEIGFDYGQGNIYAEPQPHNRTMARFNTKKAFYKRPDNEKDKGVI